MTFISLIYALILLLTVAVYWLLGLSPNLKRGIILIVSLFFYTAAQVQYIPLLLFLTGINFWLGKTIANRRMKFTQTLQETEALTSNSPQPSKFILIVGIGINVLCLLGFKYIPFTLNSLAAVLNLPAISQSAIWVKDLPFWAMALRDHLIAPLGISFFTFECLAYLIDIYRGAPASQQFLQFASYKLFFPKLISGPITRYHYFEAQFAHLQFPAVDQFAEGCWLIASGAAKKGLIADHLAMFVDTAFSSLERAGSGDLWLATLAYGLQLYFDFSGYVDIARGSAILLGFNLPPNFDFPYFSTSIADFWRRWHITLGDWLRNYLYFPLGGSRRGLTRTCLNLLMVMLIAGIWHGAAWGYVVWGGIHGIALALQRLTEVLSQRWQWLNQWWQSWLGIMVAWLITQVMVFLSWIPFRLPNLGQAGLVIQHFFNHGGDIQFQQKVYRELIGFERHHLVGVMVIILFLMGFDYYFQKSLKMQLNWPIKLVIMPFCLWVVWVFAPEGGLPYIYFDF